MDRTLQQKEHFLSIHHFILPDFFFSLFIIPLEKKNPRHYLLIFQASKSSSKQMIAITTSFTCKPLQPKCQDTRYTMVNQALLLRCLSSP